MAGSCEISNIFSNYISAMYQPEEVTLGLGLPASQPPAQSAGRNRGLALPCSPSLADKPQWFSELPYLWSKVQVLEWISYHVEKNKYDASSIDFSCCNMDGRTLCHCSREQMHRIFGPLGDDSQYALFPFIWNRHWALAKPFPQGSHTDGSKPTNPFTDFTCLPGSMSPGSSDVSGHLVAGEGPDSQDSGGSDLDLDPAESKLFPNGDKKGDSKHGKRKRGRPRKLSKESRDCLENRKSKHSPRGTHLWEFIRDILIHPELNEGLMKWEDRREGVFKFLRSEAVAQLWGQKKKNSSMTYEKLSRAMRYYYKREILERVDGRRLVYKFGKNSSGWKEEEVLNRNKEL
uniref:Uncharacterized protein n=1 Tax=Geospiza parvula TaxID=87175 RepID=A0A8U8BF01_GEOPR